MCECQDPPALYLDLCPALASLCRVTTRVRNSTYPQDILPFSPPAHPQIRGWEQLPDLRLHLRVLISISSCPQTCGFFCSLCLLTLPLLCGLGGVTHPCSLLWIAVDETPSLASIRDPAVPGSQPPKFWVTLTRALHSFHVPDALCLPCVPKDCRRDIVLETTQLRGKMSAPDLLSCLWHTLGGFMFPVREGRMTAHTCVCTQWVRHQENNVWMAFCLLESLWQIRFVQFTAGASYAHTMYAKLFKELGSLRGEKEEKVSLWPWRQDFSGGQMDLNKQTKFS